MLQTLCFKSLSTLCPVQRHDRIPLSPPPSLHTEVVRCFPFYHEPALQDVLSKTHAVHEENPLELAPLSPEKTYDTEYSSAAL